MVFVTPLLFQSSPLIRLFTIEDFLQEFVFSTIYLVLAKKMFEKTQYVYVKYHKIIFTVR